MKKIATLLLTAIVQFCWIAAPASAQQFPSHPIRMIVPFAAGGAMDIVARIVGQKLSNTGAAQIVVEDITGAGGAIGVMAVKEATPDGYVLAEVSSSTHVLNPHTTGNIPYDPVKDFQPVAMLVRVPNLLAVPASLPVNSVAELIELARKKPGGLSYGSAGVGSAPHILGALLARSSGAPMTHIPYRGNADAMNDLLGGRLDFVFSSIASLGSMVTDGKVKLLAVAGKDRIKLYPDIPSTAELGRADVDVDLWFGIVAPRGTDPEIVRILNEKFVNATNDPALAERFGQLGVEIATGTPAEFKHALESDNTRLGPLIEELTSKSN
jgi:tripartite-type tricarboxylate transporter receptor subunit TctC